MEKQKTVQLLRNILWAATPLSAVLHIFSVLLSYDDGTNYFRAGTILPVIAGASTAFLFAIAILIALLTHETELCDASPFGSQKTVAIPAAIGFAIGGILLLVEFIKNEAVLWLVTAVLLLLSAAYSLFCETEARSKEAVTLLGLLPPLACALLVGILYFDLSMEMNAPLKVVTQCALLPLMLYFTAELRYLLGRALPRLYLALALGSIAASSLCALAIPAASIAGFLNNTNCLAAALVVAGVNITVLLRLKRYLQIPSPENETKETDAQ